MFCARATQILWPAMFVQFLIGIARASYLLMPDAFEMVCSYVVRLRHIRRIRCDENYERNKQSNAKRRNALRTPRQKQKSSDRHNRTNDEIIQPRASHTTPNAICISDSYDVALRTANELGPNVRAYMPAMCWRSFKNHLWRLN